MFKDKFKNLMDKLQNNDDYDFNDDYQEDSYLIDEDELDFQPVNKTKKTNTSSFSVNKPASFDASFNTTPSKSNDFLVKVIKPLKVEDWRYICDDLRARNIIIINFEGVSSDLPQRITDYVAGACYVLNGKFRHINQNILIVVPDSINLEGDVEKSLNEKISEVETTQYNYNLDNLDNLYN